MRCQPRARRACVPLVPHGAMVDCRRPKGHSHRRPLRVGGIGSATGAMARRWPCLGWQRCKQERRRLRRHSCFFMSGPRALDTAPSTVDRRAMPCRAVPSRAEPCRAAPRRAVPRQCHVEPDKSVYPCLCARTTSQLASGHSLVPASSHLLKDDVRPLVAPVRTPLVSLRRQHNLVVLGQLNAGPQEAQVPAEQLKKAELGSPA